MGGGHRCWSQPLANVVVVPRSLLGYLLVMESVTFLSFTDHYSIMSLGHCVVVTVAFVCVCIWRNGPFIGGHLAFFFQIEFQTRL